MQRDGHRELSGGLRQMPAKRPVRRAQLISPFGVGSMVDFPKGVALMTAGLDAWPSADQANASPDWLVVEERLQGRLGVTHFRQPPDYRDPGPGVQNAGLSVPFIRFPRYHYCPRCGYMRMLSIYGNPAKCDSGKGRCAGLADRKRRYLIPVRIVALCSRGHIQDFPFHEWAHRSNTVPREGHELQYVAGGTSASLSGIVIKCSCGASQSLANAFTFDEARGGALAQLGIDCAADRPWLGDVGGQPGSCTEHLRVVQRGASNVYFPVTYSSIYLPLWAEQTDGRIIKALEDVRLWSALTSSLLEGKRINPDRCEAIAEVRGLDAEKLRDAAQRKYDGVVEVRPENEEEYRRHEYDAFRDGRGGEPSDLHVDRVPATAYAVPMAEFVREIGLVRRLRETRVLAGFTRVLPGQGGLDRDRVQPLSRRLGDKWLPATVVRGEGIFIDFRLDALTKWIAESGINAHLESLLQNDMQRQLARNMEMRLLSAKFVFLHTFAHLLIRQLSNDCGYGSASLRERIYCNTSADTEAMQGILIYTASGDSEGTMGGLVREGEPGRLEYTIARALHQARWCSADPICLESTGQGSDNGNLAACHGCALLPETSCEEGNRLLDRQAVVGRPEIPLLGFLGGFSGPSGLGQ